MAAPKSRPLDHPNPKTVASRSTKGTIRQVITNPAAPVHTNQFTEKLVKQTRAVYKGDVLDENARRFLFLACAQSGLSEDMALIAAEKLEAQLRSLVEAETRRLGGQSKLEIKELFSERADKSEKASAFLKRVWGARMKIASVSRSDIEGIDESLASGLRNEFNGRSQAYAKLVPTKPVILDTIAEHTFGQRLHGVERERANRAIAEIRRFVSL